MQITAAGSLPGKEFRGALSAMSEYFPELLPLPELPERGVGSQFVGRSLGLIKELGFDLQPAGWRLIPGSSAEHRRAQAQWRRDLDDLEELLAGFEGELKLAVAGPWSLAALVERPTGDKLLADAGARRELAQALEHAVAELLTQLRRRLPAVTPVLQLDEPLLVSVASGKVSTASGFSRHRQVRLPELVTALTPFAEASYLHCCAPGDWLPLAQQAGFAGISIDARLFGSAASLDALGDWLSQDRRLILGVLDTSNAVLQPADALVNAGLRVLRPLELAPEQFSQRLILGTGCGLANWPTELVAKQFSQLDSAAALLAEQLAR